MATAAAAATTAAAAAPAAALASLARQCVINCKRGWMLLRPCLRSATHANSCTSWNFNKQQRKNEQGKHLDIYGDYFLWPEVKPFLHDKFFFIVEVYISKLIMEIKKSIF